MKLTPKQKEVLINALAHEGDMRITNNGLKSSLMKKGLITHASGYGWGFGGIQTLTREGERIAILLKAAEHSVHSDAGDSAASSELVHASAESTSQTVTQPTQRG